MKRERKGGMGLRPENKKTGGERGRSLLVPVLVLLVVTIAAFCVIDFVGRQSGGDEEVFEPDATESTEVTAEDEEVQEVFEPIVFETVYDTVPLMFQNDYPNVWYSSGKLSKTGCSITCAAMICSYMTDTEYTPDVLAKMFNKSAYSNDKRMENALAYFDIRWVKCFKFAELKEYLLQGYTGIVLVGPGSPFTSTSHFIVITGVTEEGRYLVNDPNKNNYSGWRYRYSYENGFKQGHITCSYRGAWAIEPKSVWQSRIIKNGGWDYPDNMLVMS